MFLLVMQLLLVSPPTLPNTHLTPGAVLPVTTTQICVPGYSKTVRNVPSGLKKLVFSTYAIRPSKDFEVDHLISLELGGSNDRTNLWPESYITQPWNAHTKDALENHLHGLVCSGAISLQTAQTAIRTDWIAAYKQYLK